MTLDTTYQHEVGHAFGLDDEYAKEGTLRDCGNPAYSGLQSGDYKMCDELTTEVRSIYHYIAASRYVTKQSECQTDPDCKSGEYCDAGVDLTKNACRPLKADGAACALAGGGHQCVSGMCARGALLYAGLGRDRRDLLHRRRLRQGEVQRRGRLARVCVCKEDTDCGRRARKCGATPEPTSSRIPARRSRPTERAATWSAAGIDAWAAPASSRAAIRRARWPWAGAASSTTPASSANAAASTARMGPALARRTRTAAAGGATRASTLNACHAKLAKGADCGKVGSVGNDHKCASGECSGFPNYKCK